MEKRVETFLLAAAISGGYFLAYKGVIYKIHPLWLTLIIYALFIAVTGYIGNIIYNHHIKSAKTNSPFKNAILLYSGIAVIFLIAFFISKVIY
ncbi:hypothetical protein [Pectobacterium aroidearum]|uniref:hypothetical protein n=1 Tax=Pectobacterium aroidearum TaxID=1201031 RepID=UPI002639B77B|nr:hypothetical protein [Pectobacterium aroidearum]WKA64171.1 hypothetical protein QX495_08655 [Pectobacterium aroidearum]